MLDWLQFRFKPLLPENCFKEGTPVVIISLLVEDHFGYNSKWITATFPKNLIIDGRHMNNFPTSTWQLDAAPESTDHVQIEDAYGLFINGKFQPSSGGETFGSINPATEKRIASITEANADDVDKAVKAASNAYKKVWSKTSPAERGKYLFRIARLIQERARELSVVETMDGGKPIRESRDVDIPLVAAHFFYYAGWADKLPYAFPNRTIRSLGVAGQIIPWNFPLLMAAWKIAPALACGNTVVLKPAETTSVSAGAVGEAIVNHPGVNKIAFTGSTAVGKKIRKSIAGSEKRCTLELGGKAANVVFADAPIDQAVEGIINGIFFNQGHVCCAGSRLFVQESVRDEVLKKLKHRMGTLRVGDPLDKNTDVGAINSKQQLKRIESYLEIGQEEGAELYQAGCQLPSKGYWCRPSVFTDVAQSSRIAKEEIFGPVLAVQTFRTVAEVIKKANNTPYGLSAGVWTDKGSKIFNMTSQMKAGIVWANSYNQFDPTSPFGGFKESGFGREGGLQGLAAYLDM